MLQRLIIALLLLIPASAMAQRVATVDIDAIKAEMPETAEMQKGIDSASSQYEAEFSNLREKFQKELTDYQSLPADTPNSIKQRRAQELQELNQKMQQFVTDAQSELQLKQKNLEETIANRLDEAIRLVAIQGGYTMVFDVKTPLYIEADDITLPVKQQLGL